MSSGMEEGVAIWRGTGGTLRGVGGVHAHGPLPLVVWVPRQSPLRDWPERWRCCCSACASGAMGAHCGQRTGTGGVYVRRGAGV